MQMNEAMDYLTAEAVRLEAMGVTKSTVIMSTLTDSGNVARMSITVDIVQLAQPEKEAPAPRAPLPPQAPQMSQQQRFSGGVTGGPNPGPMPGQQQQQPMMR